MMKQDENLENIEFEPRMNQIQPNATRDNRNDKEEGKTLKVKNLTEKGKKLKMIKGFKIVVGNYGYV